MLYMHLQRRCTSEIDVLPLAVGVTLSVPSRRPRCPPGAVTPASVHLQQDLRPRHDCPQNWDGCVYFSGLKAAGVRSRAWKRRRGTVLSKLGIIVLLCLLGLS